jgi:hypothetical protein
MSGIDPDLAHRNDAAYWAAALVLAIENRNAMNEKTARENLSRLGYSLERASKLSPQESKGVKHAE